MLEKAKNNLKSANTMIIKDTFEHYLKSNTTNQQYDFIFSSMAIHHLDHRKKQELYSRIYALLKQPGLFLNADVVLPTAAMTEHIQFKMWTDYINNFLKQRKQASEVGKHDNLPNEYKAKSENQPSTLASQLNMLEDIGYKDVECYFKYGIFALFGGVKS